MKSGLSYNTGFYGTRPGPDDLVVARAPAEESEQRDQSTAFAGRLNLR